MTTTLTPHGSAEAVTASSRANNEPAWLLERRLAAWDSFQSLPLPTRTDEEWRRTDIRPLKLDALKPASDAAISPVASPLSLEGGTYGGHVVHTNDQHVESHLADHLRESGVILCSLAEAVQKHPELVEPHLGTRAVPASHDKFTAMNGSGWKAGVFIYVPAGVDVALPLRSLYGISTGGVASLPHTLVILGDEAKLTYIEEYASSAALTELALSAGTVEVILGQSAHLTLISLQEYLGSVYDINTQRALLDRDAVLDWLVVGLGDGLTKSNIEVAMQGPGARTQMLGVLWGYGNQHTDFHTLQDHQAPNCTSDLLYKGALTDDAVSVFSGRIRVGKGAHRTDSYQANRTVILSNNAAAFPSPNLEIEANDVRCTHGASVGKVDAEQLFYAMSRGLSRDLATKMIVEGFLEEVLQREPAASIRDNLSDLVRRKIEERAASLAT